MTNISNKPLLVICGPTCSGKTSLALFLASLLQGDLISADSRQVYQHMDIGTGKDIPANATKKKIRLRPINCQYTYYKTNDTNIWGYDLVSPHEEFSISQYSRYIQPVINHIWSANKLPILVGGSGLYIESIIHPPATSHITPNIKLREKLAQKNTKYMQTLLMQIDPQKWDKMNHSDRNNIRRLVRAIEIASSPSDTSSPQPMTNNTLVFGLRLSKTTIKNRIIIRVQERINQGFDQEVHKLLNSKKPLSPHASSSMGYQEWIAFIRGDITKKQAIEKWINREIGYSKRQLTWFNKKKYIHWVNIEEVGWKQHVEGLVKTWYANN